MGGRGTFPQVPSQVPEGQEWEQNPRCALCPSPPPPSWPLTAAASRQQRLHLPFLLGSSTSDDGECPGVRGMALDSNPMTLASKTYSSSVSIFREAEKRLSHHTSQDNLVPTQPSCRRSSRSQNGLPGPAARPTRVSAPVRRSRLRARRRLSRQPRPAPRASSLLNPLPQSPRCAARGRVWFRKP